MKKVDIIVSGERLPFVRDLLARVRVTGYTIVPNVSGMGHSGFYEGNLIFNETSSLVLLMTVVREEQVELILEGLTPLFERYSGIMYVSDVGVSRQDHFVHRATDSDPS
ncbi:MAG: P-II family nitrogen regulator [Nitrospirae bacterium]|nr:P-II family nitrogen regulator [Nitrospirota bacterium]